MSLVRITKNPTARQLLVFAVSWLLFFGALGLAGWLRGRHRHAAMLWALAAALPLAGLASRRILRFAFVGLSYATYPIGLVVSYIVLALVYYLALTPIGLTMRLFRYDPLARTFDPAAPSYWIPRKKNTPPESYFKQD
jgi:hypothetical protein